MSRKLVALLAAGAIASAAGTAFAGTEETRAVIEARLAAFGAQDIDKILADFTDESVMMVPGAKFVGPEQMRPLIEGFLEEFSMEGTTFNLIELQVDGEMAYINWTAETPKAVYALGTDTFIVRDGKVVMQTVSMHMTPK